MIFRIAVLKAKNGITSAQARRQAGAMDGYFADADLRFPAHVSSKASSLWVASSAVGAS